jgi:hypothetical protein
MNLNYDGWQSVSWYEWSSLAYIIHIVGLTRFLHQVDVGLSRSDSRTSQTTLGYSQGDPSSSEDHLHQTSDAGDMSDIFGLLQGMPTSSSQNILADGQITMSDVSNDAFDALFSTWQFPMTEIQRQA